MALLLSLRRQWLMCIATTPPPNTSINTVSTLPLPNGYGVGMRAQTKSAIVLLSGGIFTNRLTRAQRWVAAAMEPIYARY